MKRFLDDLRSHYGDAAVNVAQAGTTTLVMIKGVPIPRRRPVTTDVLIEVGDGSIGRGERPRVIVREDTTQPNGRRGRNVNPTLAGGETWLAFSWNVDWNTSLPAWALVAGALRRFSVNED